MNAFIKFNKGLFKMSTPVRLWLLALIAVNFIGPLFYLQRLEAQVVLVMMFVSMMLMTGLTALTGFTRIIGAGHFVWIPMLIWIWTRLGDIPTDDWFGLWIRALMVLNGISLIIDTIDVKRYFAGDREEMVKGLENTALQT
ncbi:MAG: hypothetical protein JSU59_10805 [Nitrospirota bacterium]|nr:MAG: hypothetical protein JSU59_10805 [Nitrospirota bacterium]